MSDALYCPECGGVECCDDDCKLARNRFRYERRKRKRAAERAVIEAARKHKQREDTEQSDGTWSTDWNIYYAVEALEEVERD